MKREILLLLLCFPIFLFSQEHQPLNKNELKEVIDSVSKMLEDRYVFPDTGKSMGEYIKKKNNEGKYNSISNPVAFADSLTKDIRFISNDLHLRVRFNPEEIAERKSFRSVEDSLAFVERRKVEARKNNFGFQELKILEGNIGYLDLRGFYYVTNESGAIAEAAMNFLSNTDALIIDIRNNGGGSPAMIQLISSYLFSDQPVHLNNFYFRPTDRIDQTWTLPYVPGNRMPDTDVYILTSKNSFSAAEEFCYNLKHLNRATLIGEITGGGAHPGGLHIATDRFSVWVPTGRAINPVTNTNWEGTGVEPHFIVPANQALGMAKVEAIKKIMQRAGNSNSFKYQWILDGWKAEENPVEISSQILKSYSGNYGPRAITFENEKLYYQREGGSKHLLIPMTETLFRIEAIPYFRLKIIYENGTITGVKGLYDDGRSDFNEKMQ